MILSELLNQFSVSFVNRKGVCLYIKRLLQFGGLREISTSVDCESIIKNE